MSDPLHDLELPRRQPTNRPLLWQMWGRETAKDFILLLAALMATSLATAWLVQRDLKANVDDQLRAVAVPIAEDTSAGLFSMIGMIPAIGVPLLVTRLARGLLTKWIGRPADRPAADVMYVDD